jgi:hypothetical protein
MFRNLVMHVPRRAWWPDSICKTSQFTQRSASESLDSESSSAVTVFAWESIGESWRGARGEGPSLSSRVVSRLPSGLLMRPFAFRRDTFDASPSDVV